MESTWRVWIAPLEVIKETFNWLEAFPKMPKRDFLRLRDYGNLHMEILSLPTCTQLRDLPLDSQSTLPNSGEVILRRLEI